MVTKSFIRPLLLVAAMIASAASGYEGSNDSGGTWPAAQCSSRSSQCRTDNRVSAVPEVGRDCEGNLNPTATTHFISFQDSRTGCYSGGHPYSHTTALAAQSCAKRDADACSNCAQTRTSFEMSWHSCSDSASSELVWSSSASDAERCFRSNHPRDDYSNVFCAAR